MYKVLIVEDEINAREGLKYLIESKKNIYTVDTAKDGLDGLKKAEDFHPDIIITDIKMPKLDGLEMIKKLRELNSKSEILILSGYAEFKYAQSALSLGVTDYIVKPIVPEQVFSLLEKCVENINSNKSIASPFHREHFNLLSKADNEELTMFYTEKNAVEYFYAVIYIPPNKQISKEWKTSLLENLDLTLVSLSNKRVIGIIVPIYSSISCSLSSKLKLMMKREPSLVCVYNHYPKDKAFTWFTNFEQLTRCIPWSISLNKNFFQIKDYMLKKPQDTLDGHEFRKSLKKVFYEGDYTRCKNLIIEYLKNLQEKDYPPKNILMLAASCIFKINPNYLGKNPSNYGEHNLIQAVNDIMSVNNFLELEAIIEAYYNHNASIEDNPIYSKPVLIAINEIENNYEQAISLNSTADKIGVTPQYLSRLFTKETSQNFNNYLTNYRMEKAEHFLRSTNMKVYEIAEKVGYPDAKYFCTIFKKIIGISPNQFRSNEKAQ